MAYYWIPTEQKVTQIDAALYAEWVATGNPKAQYYQPIPNPPGSDYYYDGTQWVQYPPSPPPPLTRLGFLSRFTVDELVSIELARQSSPYATQRATLTVLKETWLAAENVDVNDPRTQQGVQMLVSVGLLTAERATEILSVS